MKTDPRKGNSFYYDLDESPLNDIPFYRRFVSQNKSVLELGCGTGRVLIPLAVECKEIVGVDYSRDMVDRCRLKMNENKVLNAKAKVIVGDIRQLDLGRRFDLIIAPYRVLQALETKQEVDRVFNTIKTHLAPNGECILNVFRPIREKEDLAEN